MAKGTDMSKAVHKRGLLKTSFSSNGGPRRSIATQLVLSFILVIVLISAIFMVAGIRLITDRIVAQAQEKVRLDLNAAREIYQGKLKDIHDVVCFTADREFLMSSLFSGEMEYPIGELVEVKDNADLDILTVTDRFGNVLLRTSNFNRVGDNKLHDPLVSAVLSRQEPVAATVIESVEDLEMESPQLPRQAHFTFIETPLARDRDETEETAGMMLKAAAPVFDSLDNFIGIVYGGVLVNRDFEIVDKVKQTVFQEITYKGQDIGTATIFQDDVRISTNVKNEDGSRAIGTRVSEEVYDRVIKEGKPWIGRAYVVNNWYITTYEPIRDINDKIIGILYVGLLEQKYVDIQRQTILIFLAITLLGAFASMGLSYFIARRISVPIRRLATASKEIAEGNLDAKVDAFPNDELGELADTFNVMASALKERDVKLKEFTKKKIMEAERLALIGQLSANVAHELNNPLQGIVAYSQLLLERPSSDESATESISKIVTQANRCRDIIRGLLDFARQRKPDKTVCNVNSMLQDCVSLVEHQVLFHNIQIIKDFDDSLPTAILDPSQMERVFMNIIINAAEAMDGGGRLTLTTRFDSDHQRIEVKFKDIGQGIPEKNLESIFDPFFTTKELGHGTGLGLAISYGIVKEHRGTLSVESEVGKGTTFTISLPLTTEEEDQIGGKQA
jgi:two-component system NtrC family sensor kinase